MAQARLEGDFDILPELTPSPPEILPEEAFTSLTALTSTLAARPMPSGGDGALGGEGGDGALGGGLRLRLELNYRSSQWVLDAAMALLLPSYVHEPHAQLQLLSAVDGDPSAKPPPHPPTQPPVQPSSQGPTLQGPVVRTATPTVEVVHVADGDGEAAFVVQQILRLQLESNASPAIGVLYRTNAQAMPVERELLRQGVPYTLVQARSFFQRKEVRDALAYLRLLACDDHNALERVINVPPRRIGASAVTQLSEAASSTGKGLWATLEEVSHLRQMGEPLPVELDGLSAGAQSAMARFHTLITHFRERVTPSVAASSNATGDDEERLVLVGSQLLSRRERAKAMVKRRGQSGSSTDGDATSPSREGWDGTGSGDGVDLGVADEFEMERETERIAEDSLAHTFLQLMAESGYEKLVRGASDGTSTTRWRNIGELASMAAPYAASELQQFLDQVALVSDLDATDAHGTLESAQRAGQEPVSLMTVHASKGLEFDHVFVIGVEEDLIPHYYCTETQAEIEEERRLLYVAMTRARHALTLSHAAERSRYGRIGQAEPSRFLADLPPELAPRRVVKEAAGRSSGPRRGRNVRFF